jgi:hypothetical protein
MYAMNANQGNALLNDFTIWSQMSVMVCLYVALFNKTCFMLMNEFEIFVAIFLAWQVVHLIRTPGYITRKNILTQYWIFSIKGKKHRLITLIFNYLPRQRSYFVGLSARQA